MSCPRFSIIVPVYNSSAHLHRCVDSILRQTISDFELLLVDDGSTDNSGSICDEYAVKDKRIRVFHKENGGVSSARNLGLENAIGDWIAFVDSDDFLDETFLKNFYSGLADDAELIVQGFFYHDIKQNQILECKFEEKEVNDNIELIRLFEEQDIVHNGFIWHRLFKASIIKEHSITFPVGIHYGEDGIFFFRYLNFSSCTRFVNKGAYHYIFYSGGDTLTSRASTLLFSEKIVTLKEIAAALMGVSKKRPDFIYSYIWRLIDQWFISTMFNVHRDKEYDCYNCLNEFFDKFGNCFYPYIYIYIVKCTTMV